MWAEGRGLSSALHEMAEDMTQTEEADVCSSVMASETGPLKGNSLWRAHKLRITHGYSANCTEQRARARPVLGQRWCPVPRSCLPPHTQGSLVVGQGLTQATRTSNCRLPSATVQKTSEGFLEEA